MIYDIKKVKQLRLVSGDEIMCEILEEDEQDIIIRNALSIQFNVMENGSRMWSFKYFMCYQDDPERFILLKMDKIVAIANPIHDMVKQYVDAVGSMMDHGEEIPDPLEEEEEPEEKSNVVDFPTIH